VAIANSHGQFAYHQHTLADFNTVVMGEDSSGWAAAASLDAGMIDGECLASEAVEKALRSKHPQPLEPGTYTVVLEEYAVLDLLQYLAYKGFSAEDVLAGRSFMSGHDGELLVNENISIWDDGHDVTGIPSPFDFEGTPKQRVELITRGRVGSPVYDRLNAKKAGRASTGHFSGGAAFWGAGPQATNVFMAPGTHSKEDMLASTERGIWVTRFHYCNMLDSRRTTVTGMTRDGTFLIEQGKLVRPVLNMRFTHAVLDALRDVVMVGNETKLEVNWFGGGNRAPALKIENFRFTGKTNF
jgi:PmbA protein